jgi:hypothetical protein
VVLVLGEALPASAATGEVEPRVEVQVAWEGVARAGRWTEFSVSVLSQQGGEVVVEARDSRVTSRVTGQLEAGVAGTFRVPVLVEGSVVPIAVVGPDGREVVRDVPLRIPAPDRRIVAAPSGALRVPRLEAVVVELNSRTFPHFARAFDMLDLLVLDARTLSGLSLAQLVAIRQYVARCGRLLLLATQPGVSPWRGEAGCSAAFVEVSPLDAAVAEPVALLLESRVPQLPGAPELSRELSESRPHAARMPLITFFAVYAFVLVIGGFALQNVAGLAAIPIAAGLLLPGIFSLAAPAFSGGVWAEATSGASTARLAALVRIDGLARRPAAFEVPAALGPPEPVSGGKMQIEIEPREAHYRVQVETHLFSRNSFYLRSALHWEPALSLERGAGGLRVRNGGSGVSAPGFVVWHERAFPLPALEPGGETDPARGDPLPGRLQPRAVADARSAGSGPAIVLPEPPRASGLLEGVHWTGWTLISAGGSP